MRKFDFKLPTPEIGDQFGPIDDVTVHPLKSNIYALFVPQQTKVELIIS